MEITEAESAECNMNDLVSECQQCQDAGVDEQLVPWETLYVLL